MDTRRLEDESKAITFYNNSTPKERVEFLNMIARDIFVFVQEDTKFNKGGHNLELDLEVPVCTNGAMIQINVEPITEIK